MNVFYWMTDQHATIIFDCRTHEFRHSHREFQDNLLTPTWNRNSSISACSYIYIYICVYWAEHMPSALEPIQSLSKHSNRMRFCYIHFINKQTNKKAYTYTQMLYKAALMKRHEPWAWTFWCIALDCHEAAYKRILPITNNVREIETDIFVIIKIFAICHHQIVAIGKHRTDA